MSDFEAAFKYLQVDEAGYWDDPAGGPTKYGITMHILAVYRQAGVTEDDIKNLTLERAAAIYKLLWWDRLDLGIFPQSIATAILDVLVNLGEPEGAKLVQTALGQASPDGIIGKETKAQLLTINPTRFIKSFVSVIQDHYCDIVIKNPNRLSDLKGWIRRAFRLMTLI